MAKFGTQTRTDHVRNVLGFMFYRVVVTKIMTFFQKCVQVGLHFCSGDLRSVGGTVGSRPIPAAWLAGCRSVGRYSDVTGVSLSDWPNIGRWPKRAGCSFLQLKHATATAHWHCIHVLSHHAAVQSFTKCAVAVRLAATVSLCNINHAYDVIISCFTFMHNYAEDNHSSTGP